jgi:hypothetical protein
MRNEEAIVNQQNNGIIQKIRKLHALAERASTEAEAALAAARVQDLLTKYNLDLGEVVLKEDPGGTMEAGRAWRRIPEHASTLAIACNDIFDVLHYLQGHPSRGWRFVFIGLRTNVEAAALTYEYLVESIEALVQGAKRRDLIHGSEEFLAFRLGASMRIRELARERKVQTMAADPRYGELVHIGKALAQSLHQAIKFEFVRGSGFGGFMNVGSTAYSHGYAEGSRVDLTGARTGRMLKTGDGG